MNNSNSTQDSTLSPDKLHGTEGEFIVKLVSETSKKRGLLFIYDWNFNMN